MTRRTYAYDSDLDAVVQIRGPETNRTADRTAGITIIRDIEPYRTAASDIGADGKRVVIGSRSRHREFLSRNGYVEVGNERPVSGDLPSLSRAERVADIRRAMGDM
jgi:hypothetical protein